MSFWDKVQDASRLKSFGIDLGGISRDIFGNNKGSDAIDIVLDAGTQSIADDEKRLVEAEEMRAKRALETAKINATFSPLKIKRDDVQKYGVLVGIVVFMFGIIFLLPKMLGSK